MSDTVATTQPRDMRPRMSAEVPDTAMVLAAGLGTRMRPLTDDRPKALVEVGGRTLIDRALDALARAGVGKAVVNLHAHADRLEAHLTARSGGPRIVFSDERGRLLDTGGGVKRALPLLGADPFFVVNCDALWRDGLNDTLVHLASRWDGEAMDTMLLIVLSHAAVAYDGRGDFDMDPKGRLAFRPERTITPYVYGGVHIQRPGPVAAIDKAVFSLRAVWRQAEDEGRLYGLIHEGRWAHVGTPEAVRLAERKLLDERHMQPD